MLVNRPYQQRALDRSVVRKQEGVWKQLFCFPTGTGKTPLIAGMKKVHNIDKRQMVLVHREELAESARDKIKAWNPTFRVGIEMADSYASDSDDVVVASVPTIGRSNSSRLLRFKPEEFGLITTDEAHHGTAESYKSIYSHFDVLGNDNRFGILQTGVTATPNRTDSQGLGQIYDEIVDQMSILDAITEGWLVNVRGFKLSTSISLDSVSTSYGDFNEGSLAGAINTPKRNKTIIDSWKQIARQERGYRSTIAFCANVQHAQDLAKAFNDEGISAAAIWAGDKDRKRKLELHRKGTIVVLTNCGILTEGYDDPNISCVIMARPTKSSLLFTQMVGRGTRIPTGIDNLLDAIRQGKTLDKTDCLVLDVVDTTSRHSLVTLASLFGLAPKADLEGKTITDVLQIVDEVKEKRPEIILDNLERIEQLTTEEVDMFADRMPPEIESNTKLKWTKISESEYQILLPLGERVKVFKNLLDTWSISGVVAGTGFVQDGMTSLPEAFRMADQFISMFGKGLLNHLRQKPLAQKAKPVSLSPKASVAQKSFVSKLYKNNAKVLSAIDNMTAKEASNLIHSFNRLGK